MRKQISSLLVFAIVILNVFILKTEANNKTFPDVVKGSWYEGSVNVLAEAGIIDGFHDGTFRPDIRINVDEFIKLLVTAMGYVPERSEGYWAQGYIDCAYDHGIIMKGEIRDFRRNISRGEMSRMIVRVADIRGFQQYSVYQKNIGDFDEIDARYKEYALAGYGSGIIAGIGGEFRPYEPASRKEACVMIHRLIDPDRRLKNEPLGIIEPYLTVEDLYEKLENEGFITEQASGSDILTREKMAAILYKTIMLNEQLKKSIVPGSEEVKRPMALTDSGRILSETFYSICSDTRTIEQNFQALQIFDILKTYSDGTKVKIMNYNKFKDADLITNTTKDIAGMESICGSEVKMRFDYLRFEEIFRDAYQIKDEYAEAFFRVYDLGIMDLHEYSEHTLDVYCSPGAAVSEKEADAVIARLLDVNKRSVYDEKGFGIGDSWGTDLYGSEKYIFRLSEIKMIYLYETIIGCDPVTAKIRTGSDGIYMLLACMGYPYFDDLFMIADDCGETGYNYKGTSMLAGFCKYDIYKYSAYVPKAYKEQFISDLKVFAGGADKEDFKCEYGGFVFEAYRSSAFGIPSINFQYAYREDE